MAARGVCRLFSGVGNYARRPDGRTPCAVACRRLRAACPGDLLYAGDRVRQMGSDLLWCLASRSVRRRETARRARSATRGTEFGPSDASCAWETERTRLIANRLDIRATERRGVHTTNSSPGQPGAESENHDPLIGRRNADDESVARKLEARATASRERGRDEACFVGHHGCGGVAKTNSSRGQLGDGSVRYKLSRMAQPGE